MNFSNQLTYYRKALGLTQEQLAEKCNVTRQAVAKWESGASLPDLYMIITLADIFEITVDQLLNHDKVAGSLNLWEKVCKSMKNDMSEISYRTWIEPLRLEEINEDRKQIRVTCESDFIVNIINKRYLSKIKSLIETMAGDNYSIVVYHYS